MDEPSNSRAVRRVSPASRRRAILAVAVLAAALTTALPMVPASATTTRSTVSAQTVRHAEQSARRIVTLMPLPPGWQPLLWGWPANVQRPIDSGPALGSQTIILKEYSIVPMPIAAARKWFTTHLPLGGAITGTAAALTDRGNVLSYVVEYFMPAFDVMPAGELHVGMVPDGPTHTLLQDEAQVTYVPGNVSA